MSDITDDLIALAERVEAATGPDREIDRVIFALLRPENFEDATEAATYANPSYRGNVADWRYLSDLGLPRCTASIDAAMQLVPEGWTVSGLEESWYDGVWRAKLAARPSAALRASYEAGRSICLADAKAESTTASLALCSASLRARAAA